MLITQAIQFMSVHLRSEKCVSCARAAFTLSICRNLPRHEAITSTSTVSLSTSTKAAGRLT